MVVSVAITGAVDEVEEVEVEEGTEEQAAI